MQTFKGIIALLLVAAGVFTAVMIFNRNSEPGREAAMAKAITTDTVKSQSAGSRVSQPADQTTVNPTPI
jgi:hypothetical protein